MNFKAYLNQAWADHAKDPNNVKSGFSEGISLIQSNEELGQLAGLMTHVMGEHLGKWIEGIKMLSNLTSNRHFQPQTESAFGIQRSIAALSLAADDNFSLQEFSFSDQIRILSVAGSALSERQTERAREFLLKALDLARQGLDKQDPANRALAITANNLACALEDKKNRSASETELMLISASAAREFWEIAGTWLHIERAEYRLAMSYLKAQDLTKAILHAQNCLEICQEHNLDALELFFGYEALAKIEHSRGNHLGFETALAAMQIQFEKMAPENRPWCEASLQKITDLKNK